MQYKCVFLVCPIDTGQLNVNQQHLCICLINNTKHLNPVIQQWEGET